MIGQIDYSEDIFLLFIFFFIMIKHEEILFEFLDSQEEI